ncbi:centromere protein L-like [Saccoglossus kowalevskii]|uniref:Centromere protein L n=1 Tax=Saccoglossus kowalevskii TaxID=10224 RepID=A0ABM0GU49_SACKO|nr:PREDICTED: centromere protein L-like [Saccoglossus kowalevskii]
MASAVTPFRTPGTTPWPSRRHMPYTKTPTSRRLTCKTHRRFPRLRNERLQVSRIKELVDKTWKVYKATPFFNFSYKSEGLKRYSRHLSAHLEAESSKNIVDVEGELGEHGTFEIMNGVALSESDVEAVEITVKTKKQNGNEDGKVVLIGVLCSVEIAEECVIKNKQFTNLPVFLVKGNVAVTRHVINFLQAQFDSNIIAMHFPPMELAWMIAMWTGFIPDAEESNVATSRNIPLELVYRVPEEIEGLRTITMTIRAQDAKKMWKCVHNADSEEFTNEEMNSFIHGIEQHFYYHFKIKLAAMSLHTIRCSIASVDTDGRLKILSNTSVHEVLRHVTQLIVDSMPPSICVS